MPTVQVNDITISYTFHTPSTSSQPNGTATEEPGTIVLVNGLADSQQTWSSQTPAFLAAGYRVLTYDNRGIGQSSAPAGPYTSALLASDLHGLLQTLGIKQAHFLGVSMGGMILQEYALSYPSGPPCGIDISSLTLACTYSAPGEFCSRMFQIWSEMARKMSVQDVMRDVTLWAFTVPFFTSRTDELRAVERDVENLELSLEAYLAQLNVIQRFDSRNSLLKLREDGKWLGGIEPRKVMVLAGRTDILTPVTLSRDLAEKIDGAQFKTVKGGHGCLWEFPRSFNETVLEFLRECKSDG
ncbi:hypothetical protein AC579_3755 [Pseudocercospora musae]|uniref:AB hydrolase-1 domain-containing protein n=1 Tax=Pseudocercospora musae TaxID=113226 RepID=A0A139ING4_9PEZI|nr:hypothetical protein AC579_3755 [Pseudocercospora musae]